MKSETVLTIAGVALAAYIAWDVFAKPGTLGKPPRKVIKLSEWPVEMAAAAVFGPTHDGGPFFAGLGPGPGPAGFVGYFGEWLASEYAAGLRIFVRQRASVLDYDVYPSLTDNGIPDDFAELVKSP